MEAVDFDDEFDIPDQIQTNVYSNVRVFGPGAHSNGDLHAQSDDEDSDSDDDEFVVHSSEVRVNGSNKAGFGAHALPNSAVIGAMTPRISSVLGPATCNY